MFTRGKKNNLRCHQTWRAAGKPPSSSMIFPVKSKPPFSLTTGGWLIMYSHSTSYSRGTSFLPFIAFIVIYIIYSCIMWYWTNSSPLTQVGRGTASCWPFINFRDHTINWGQRFRRKSQVHVPKRSSITVLKVLFPTVQCVIHCHSVCWRIFSSCLMMDS